MRIIFKCDDCGRFISLKDLEDKKAFREIITVDTEFSREEFITMCKKCYAFDKLKGKISDAILKE